MSAAFPLLDKFVAFIVERHSIYMRRQGGHPKPWTEDPILQSFRFCNVYRELDTVTLWISNEWRFRYRKDEDLWFAMVVARLVNWPDTLAELMPAVFTLDTKKVQWDEGKFIRAMHRRRKQGEKVFTGAYIVSTNGVATDKADYIGKKVLTKMWRKREELRPREGDTLEAFHTRLTSFMGMGSFIAGQVVADIKYAEPLARASDWHTWAAKGPGSSRGLNRVCGNERDERWKPAHWLQVLQELQEVVNPMLPLQWEKLHAQDLQNCLCEFDKYMRVTLGEGRPRSRYPGRP